MGCCTFANNLPEHWSSLPSIPDEKKVATTKINWDIQHNLQLHNGIPEEYHANIGIRIIVIALLVFGISAGVMALDGTLSTFPQYVKNLFQNVNWVHVGIGTSVFTVLTVGAAFLIHKVHHEIDPYTKNDSNRFTGDAQWVPVLFQSNGDAPNTGYIDTSTLTNESGYAYLYVNKDEQNHYSVSSVVFAVTPIYMILTIAYNVIRLCIIPFYILGCLIYEKCTDQEIETGRRFRPTDILWEIAYSLWRIVKAPFYAVAFMYATLYSFFDPLNGRKLGSYLERHWNRVEKLGVTQEVTRTEGFWSVGGPQRLWKCEGGGTPSGLGRNGFYLAGCWQPVGRVKYVNGIISEGESLSRAVQPPCGRIYIIHTAASTAQRHEDLITNLKKHL